MFMYFLKYLVIDLWHFKSKYMEMASKVLFSNYYFKMCIFVYKHNIPPTPPQKKPNNPLWFLKMCIANILEVER